MRLLLGKSVAEKILNQLKNDIFKHESKPGLAVILVGNDKASHLYVNLKEKTAKEIGMNFFRHDLDGNVSEEEILQLILKLNLDSNVHGMIVQLPLPKGFDTQKIISSIDLKKDADGFSANGESDLELAPVFPKAIMKLIESSEQKIVGKKAVVIANSDLFGKIMIKMLGQEGVLAEYLLVSELPLKLEQIKGADIVVSAVGSPALLKGQMLKSGSIVIDGGITKVGEKVLGDVDFGSTEALDGHITPVPGGVGPVTIACLLQNTFLAFEAQEKEKNS